MDCGDKATRRGVLRNHAGVFLWAAGHPLWPEACLDEGL